MGTTAINLSQEVPGKNIKEYLFDTGSLEKIPNGFSVDLNMKKHLGCSKDFFFMFSIQACP